MLKDHEIASFRAALQAEREALLAEQGSGAGERAIVTLDQQSVGRLSRMDAMQRQAMAQATARRRQARASRIEAALGRIEDGEFGYCQDCGEEIGSRRLELDPTLPTCVSCARG
jgi:DnaK suppressor protein